MNQLINILNDFKTPNNLSNSEAKSDGLSDEQLKVFQNRLDNLSKRNTTIFWIIFSIVIIVFILSLLFVIENRNDPTKIKATFGVTGLSIMGLIYYMATLWKQKNYIDLITASISILDKNKIGGYVKLFIDAIK